VTGTDPFTTHQNILVDVCKGAFGNSALQPSDFQAAASQDAIGAILNTPVENWYAVTLDKTALSYINLTGVTQFRLRFQIANNNDQGADTIKFFSGDYSPSSNRPILQVEYYVP